MGGGGIMELCGGGGGYVWSSWMGGFNWRMRRGYMHGGEVGGDEWNRREEYEWRRMGTGIWDGRPWGVI